MVMCGVVIIFIGRMMIRPYQFHGNGDVRRGYYFYRANDDSP